MPIDAGVKLTGTIGRTDVGVLDVRTGDSDDDVLGRREELLRRPRQTQPVPAVVRRRALHRRPSGARAVRPDLRRRPAPGDVAFSRRSRAISSSTRTASGASTRSGSDKDWSYGFSAHYPNDRFIAQVVFREIQENFKPALGFVQRDNVRLLRVAGSYNPRPRNFLNIQQMNHDVFYTRFTRLDNDQVESWDLYVTLAGLALQVRRQHPRDSRLQPDLRAAVRAVRDLARRHSAPGRVPVHALQEQSRFRRRRNAGSRAASQVTWGNYWSGKAEQVHGQRHLQAAAAVHDQREHEPDVRPAARRAFHRAHLHVERRVTPRLPGCRSRI